MSEQRVIQLNLTRISPADRYVGGDGRPAAALEEFETPPFRQIRAYQEVPVPLWRDVVERFIAFTLLLFSLPFCIVIAAVIRFDSPGPILFRQWRVGLGGRRFRFTKFRTYYADAERRFPHLYSYSYTPAEVDRLFFKVPNDPRATRVGAWLRKSTLDELPNLWHVVTGDMSLVGPRPEIPPMLPYYLPSELRKFSVRPGITGIAQISGRGLLSFRETVRLDLKYVDERSVWGDLTILAITLIKVALRQGAF